VSVHVVFLVRRKESEHNLSTKIKDRRLEVAILPRIIEGGRDCYPENRPTLIH
jgi:hypothetical protein